MKPVEKMTGGGNSSNSGKGGAGSAKTGNGGAICALCDKPVAESYSPFCSRRCADIDLGRWLKGQYAIPASLGGGVGSAEDED